MSVVSQKIGANHYRGHRVGMSGRGPRSVIGAGFDVDGASYLLPRFSALKSEGSVKLNMPDEWGEDTTVVGTEQSFALGAAEKPAPRAAPPERRRRSCAALLGFWVVVGFCLFSVFSGLAMALLPFLLVHSNFYETKEIQCELECTTNLFTIVVFTVVLALFVWTTAKPKQAALPRVQPRRLAFIFLIVFILAGFWLFYIVQAVLRSSLEYEVIQKLAQTLLFVLLLLHVLWIVFDNKRQAQKFIVTVVRDPDGEARQFQLGQTSIQEAAVELLLLHDTQFPFFNAAADRARTGTGHKTLAQPSAGFKLYDIDGQGERELDDESIKKLVEVAAKQSATLAGDFSAEEQDRERRLKRKKYRLMLAAEEAFTQIGAISQGRDQTQALDAAKAARVVSGAIGKHLHRFLRSAHRQHFFPGEPVMRRLEFCFRHGFSARAFLSPFFGSAKPDSEYLPESRWAILSERIVTQQLSDGLEFVLRSQDEAGVQLHCQVQRYPFYNLTEAPCRRR